VVSVPEAPLLDPYGDRSPSPVPAAAAERHAGILVPLFSIPSTRSWGIGEIGDLVAFAAWLRAACLDVLQILPVHEMAEGQHSPYSALSAMAIDPIYIAVGELEEFRALGGEAGLDLAAQADLAEVRRSLTVDYDTVRTLKDAALRAAFDRFHDEEWIPGSPRADAFAAYVERERWWLDDYALFRVLHARFRQVPWWQWPDPFRTRAPEALEAARREEAREILYRQYLQWVAETQWQRARAAAGVLLFGDFPFMVSGDSADVWTHQAVFDLDASVGAPPDAFAPDGQNWGMPAYRWEEMRAADFAWLRARARRSAALYDGVRVDHAVGFYRTYIRPTRGAPHFVPATEPEQLALGEQVMAALAQCGPRLVAEDLGTVPDFVRASLARLGIPGYKVLRWEREWDRPGRPFRDPAAYPRLSVATTGTHDTEPLAVWWDALGPADRAALAALPRLARYRIDWTTTRFTAAVRDALLDLLFSAPSTYIVLPLQDVFGWRDRINVPGTVSEDNWTWRALWPSDVLLEAAEPRERAAALCAVVNSSRAAQVPPRETTPA
jgi:4-alpha-glucanotransferase